MLTKGIMEFVIEIGELLKHAEQIVGLFYDSTQGASAFTAKLEGLVQHEISRGHTRETAMNAPVIHGDGDPNDGGKAIHRSKLGDVINRCKPHGENEIFLGEMCLVSLYTFWDSRTRGGIAKALGIELDNVKSDLFGDIRILRNISMHVGSTADNTVRRCKVLTWFKPGDKVVIDRDKLRQIVDHIRKFPEGLHTPGFDPTEGT